MPVSSTEVLSQRSFLPVKDVQHQIGERTPMTPDPTPRGNGPAVYYRLPEYGAIVGFIGAMTTPHFCDGCRKIRLTADGKIRPCLGHHLEFDLKPALREKRDLEAVRETFDVALVHCKNCTAQFIG